MISKAIITAIANQQDAISMSVSGGQAQSNFVAMATTNPAGTGAVTHCWANGSFEDATVALYLADPRFQVKQPASPRGGRPASVVLAECSPQLYPWVGP